MFFSIIIPCFNVSETIEKTLSSVLNQNLKSFEIIAVNDGSFDNTLEILEKYESNSLLRIISQENKGLGAARNTGINNSSGKYISLLDADDLWPVNKLEILYKFIKSTKANLISNDEIIFENSKNIKYLSNKPPTNLKSLLLEGNSLSPSAMTINRKVFNRVGYFIEDKKLLGVEDWDFWLRAIKGGEKIRHINKPLGIYRRDIQNMSKLKSFDKRVLKIYELHSRDLIFKGIISSRDYKIGKNFLYLRNSFRAVLIADNKNFTNNFKILKFKYIFSFLMIIFLVKSAYRRISSKIKSIINRKKFKCMVRELL